jgi:hypothetical protein
VVANSARWGAETLAAGVIAALVGRMDRRGVTLPGQSPGRGPLALEAGLPRGPDKHKTLFEAPDAPETP